MPTLTPSDLATITVFAGLPDEVLNWLLTHGTARAYAPDAVINAVGDAADELLAVVRGRMQFYRLTSGQREPVFRLDTGQVGGVLPYSRLQTYRGEAVAVGETLLYALPRTEFTELERVSLELVQRLVAAMNDRARDEVRGQERDDKLRALGKLSAGLAHELNNPAAAIGRAAHALAAASTAQPAAFCALLHQSPTPTALAALTDLSTPSAASPTSRSALAISQMEDDLADWLTAQGVADAYRLAPTLAEAGLNETALAPVAAAFAPAARPLALAWLEGQLAVAQMTRNVQEASTRISQLVADVKTYSHQDRGTARETLDVTTGLDSTLNILGFALRQKNIRLTRAYAPGLPPIRGVVSSLNQVWTNLIDNAVDALPVGGSLTVRTVREGDFVKVLIEDNGPGIPADVLPHIFEPFYTTKPVGEGSGLGLEIAQRIIRQHDGRLEVQTSDKGTTFCAWLPVGGG